MATNRKFTADNNELLAMIQPEMARLTNEDSKCRAPSRVTWDVRRTPGLPSANYLIARFRCGWPELVERCGCIPARSYVRADGTVCKGFAPTGLADEIEAGLAAGTIQHASWMDRFQNRLHVIPTPTRVETVRGRTVSGQPIIIHREYYLVR